VCVTATNGHYSPLGMLRLKAGNDNFTKMMSVAYIHKFQILSP
jgi:hypothetical protein